MAASTRRTVRKKNEIMLPAIQPSAAITARYRKSLFSLIDEMQRSAAYWLKAAWRKNPPVTMAIDASTPVDMKNEVHKLRAQWERQFDDGASALAKYFATKVKDRVDGQLERILQDAGFAIDFKMTPRMREIMQATTFENVSLIKSIPSQYFEEVEGLVMRAVAKETNLFDLTNELEKRYEITRKRAMLIADDQTRKANALITRTRELECGVTHAIWMHSHGGRYPRPEHVRADGEVFDLRKGKFIDGEWIFPGEKINCHCWARGLMKYDMRRMGLL